MTGTTPSRRQVVRAGAWTVPAVAVATVAPAYAASGANLSTSNGSVTRNTGGNQFLTATINLINSGTAATSALTITFTVAGLTSASVPANSGWTQTAINTTAGTVTFTRTGSQIPAPGTLTTVFTFQRSTSGSTTIFVDADPGGGGIHYNPPSGLSSN